MRAYIPKAWRPFVGKLEPVASPVGPVASKQLPPSIGNAQCWDGSPSKRSVQEFFDKLEGGTEFTLADLALAAGLASDKLNQPIGTVEFRGVVRSLMLGGRIVPGRKGRSGGNVAAEIKDISDEIGLL